MSVGRFASYNLIGAAIPLALTFVTLPIYLALVGIDRVGILSLAWLLLGYFGLFDLGLGKATAYRIAAQRDASAADRAETLWGALIVNVGMGIVGGAVLWLASHLYFAHYFKVNEALRPEILAAVPLLALSVPVATLTGVLTGALQGREKFLEANQISTASTILFQIMPLAVAWFWGPTLSWLLVAALSSRALALWALWQVCHKEFVRGQRVHVERTTVAALLRYGGWVSLNGLIGPLLVIVDRFAIGNVLGATVLGYYHVPFQIAKQLAIVPGSLTGALFPKLTAASPGERTALNQKALLTLASTITVPVMVGIFLMEPFLHLWVGNAIAQTSGSVGRVLLIGSWCNAMALVPFTQLQAAGRPRTVTIVYLIQIPIYLVGLYFAMIYFGIVGCAVALAVRFGIDYIMLSIASEGKVPLIVRFFGLLVMLTAACIVCNLLAITDPLWWLLAVSLLAVASFASLRLVPADVSARILSFVRRFLLKGRVA